jgi:hypothetical protein
MQHEHVMLEQGAEVDTSTCVKQSSVHGDQQIRHNASSSDAYTIHRYSMSR